MSHGICAACGKHNNGSTLAWATPRADWLRLYSCTLAFWVVWSLRA